MVHQQIQNGVCNASPGPSCGFCAVFDTGACVASCLEIVAGQLAGFCIVRRRSRDPVHIKGDCSTLAYVKLVPRRLEEVDTVFWDLVRRRLGTPTLLEQTGIVAIFRNSMDSIVEAKHIVRSHLPDRPWGVRQATLKCPTADCGHTLTVKEHKSNHSNLRLACTACGIRSYVERPAWLTPTTGAMYTLDRKSVV